jgi:hypothetical protein
MEKDFVPYQEALVLKQLGFDEPCFATYDINFDTSLVSNRDYTSYSDDAMKYVFNAPLYQQVFRWFREKHNINTVISWRDDLLNFDISLTEMKKHGYFYYKDNFTTYEEAELASLQQLIKIVKKC